MEEGWQKGLNALGGATMNGGLDAYAVMVATPEELDPKKAEGAGLFGDLQLTDIESGRVAEVTVSDATVARYQELRARHESEWKHACTARGVAPFVISTATTVDDVVLNSLRRGGLVW
jgi:hypothetical protein